MTDADPSEAEITEALEHIEDHGAYSAREADLAAAVNYYRSLITTLTFFDSRADAIRQGTSGDFLRLDHERLKQIHEEEGSRD